MSISSLRHVLTRRVRPKLRNMSSAEPRVEEACFGAGCFWGTEKFFKVDFLQKYPNFGVQNVQVGYMGPKSAIANPTYGDVCTGTTQHVEVCHFDYIGGEDAYEALCRHFFSFHDPTTLNRQGNDIGTQYASVIYYYNQSQQEIAERVKAEFQVLLNEKRVRYADTAIRTDLQPATKFYEAEPEHQDYLLRNPGGYCNHFYRIDAT